MGFPSVTGAVTSATGAVRTRSRRARTLVVLAALALLVPLLTVSSPAGRAAADTPIAYTTTTVLLGDQQIIGALYQPTKKTANQATGLFLTHENSDFIGSVPCVQLAQRGFTVLCAKSQYDEQAVANWDALALDVSAGVSYLRGLSTVHKVVLVGWSGGGAIMSYYQNVATNGLGACQDPQRLDPCGDDLAGMPAADGVVLLDAIPGIAFSDLTAWDASVTNESNLNTRNEALDMYSPANGYNATGSSNYSQAFINRYLNGQSAREDRIVSQAQKLQKKVTNGTAGYTDDAPMPIGRDAARIWQADSALISHTQGEYPLLSPQHPAGGAPQVVNSVRVPSARSSDNSSWSGGGNDFTADSYMSIAAVKTTKLRITDDSISGIDWASTNTATVDNVAGITTPLLIMSMTGHYWLVPSEMYYNNATRTSNKQLVFVEGATHGFTPCTACATTPGEFGDTVGETFNYVANWLTTNM
jgi:pimeloyl-ACP methyl ester carboxylesterase